MTTVTDPLRAWDDFHRTQSGITAEIIGAADYLRQHPEYATDARVAAVFWEYVARIEATAVPK